MVSVWMTVVATFSIIVGVSLFTASYRWNLRVADECADRFVEEVDEMARSGAFPRELIEYLYRIGAHVDNTAFAMRACHNFKMMKKRGVSLPNRPTNITRAFDRLAYSEKIRFAGAVALFLGSICYRDPINGSFMRRVLLSPSRDKAIKEETVALEDMCRDDGGLAHA